MKNDMQIERAVFSRRRALLGHLPRRTRIVLLTNVPIDDENISDVNPRRVSASEIYTRMNYRRCVH